MSKAQQLETEVSLYVKNIGGIDESQIEIPNGVTALVGRNATNRTSLLQAVMAACGSDNFTLKGNADEGCVELTVDGAKYSRHLRRDNGTISADGEAYLDDPTVAELFAFLLESNEARQAVTQGDGLRDIIMRPVDIDSIQAEVRRLENERDEIENELEALNDARDRLPELERKRDHLTEQIEEKGAEIEKKSDKVDSADVDIGETRAEEDELKRKLNELNSLKSSLEDVRATLDTERERKSNIREERADVDASLDELSDVPIGEVRELDTELTRLRERKQTVESAMNQLQRIIQFNETLLEGENEEVLDALTTDANDEDGAVTDKLLTDPSLTCWTCGTEVEPDAVETTLEKLRNLRKAKLNEVNEIDSRIKEIQTKKRELEQQQQERNRLENRLDSLDDELNDAEETIVKFETRREELVDQIDQLKNEVDELESESHSELLDLHKEVNQLEFERERLEDQRDEVVEEITKIESRLDTEDDLESQREQIRNEIVDHRTRIEHLETEAVNKFNSQMEDLLQFLNFDNLERIWLERRETETRRGRQKVQKSVFELHVVRTNADGAAYEDTVAHLSESEREVTGIVFALAGYLAHEVYETLPFLLLDSLEAIDSQRIATLIDYVSDYAEFVIAVLLPEDASALSEEYHQIKDIN